MASAAPAESFWTYRYTGFLNADTQQFDAGATWGGYFRGTDRNADGIIQKAELSEFRWNYTTAEIWSDREYCYMYNGCYLDQFSYDTRSGKLNFDFDAYIVDEHYSSSIDVVAGQAYQSKYSGSSSREIDTWHWTAQTRFEITPAPVPEPATVWMLGAGLGALGLAARRRRS
ncbi:hypothetical protein C9I28_10455 [Pseudoduganella armeniaca]|uniref:Ice-binding protein C-terminal domain-containing protein n=2 Tax=Pseudoduganella armeniaca TaxID=2072590 RepID=A0A2R4CHK0_9BURK|nr:hypothetical protein C9I28_10455 [Pseudoduganella armeniaca]